MCKLFVYRSSQIQDEIVKMIKFWVRAGIDGIFWSGVHYYFEADDVSLDEPKSDLKGVEPVSFMD